MESDEWNWSSNGVGRVWRQRVFTRDIKCCVTLEEPGLIEGGVRRVGRSPREKELSGKAVEVKECIPFNGTMDHIIFPQSSPVHLNSG